MTDDIEAIIETGSVAAIEIAASALAERGARTGNCANCTHTLVGPYCAICGQPTKTRRRSIRGLVHDFFLDLINFDSRILRTGRALLLEPGELPKAFREGRTVPYVPSIRLYLFVSLIFFVALSLTGIAVVQLQVKATPVKVIRDARGDTFIANPAYDPDDKDPDTAKVIKPLIPIDKAKASRPGGVFTYSTEAHFFSRIGSYRSTLTDEQRRRLLEAADIKIDGPGKAKADGIKRAIDATMEKLAADPAALNGPLTVWIPRALFLLLPLYALVLALFHIRRLRDFFLVDHLVFSLGIHTFTFVLLMVAAALAQVFPGEWIALALFVVLSVYIFLAMKRFYEQGWFLTAVKFVFISGIYTIFCLLPALAAVFVLSVLGDPFG
ncbi:MAG: DUF3667 domain-containing protein [Rhizomicrobium sp.]